MQVLLHGGWGWRRCEQKFDFAFCFRLKYQKRLTASDDVLACKDWKSNIKLFTLCRGYLM